MDDTENYPQKAFKRRNKKSWLEFNLGLVLIGLQTTELWVMVRLMYEANCNNRDSNITVIPRMGRGRKPYLVLFDRMRYHLS